MLKGNKEKMFGNFNSIVISETGARNLFGKEDPMGKVISLKHLFATQGKEVNVMVTGVYRDYPSNSHFKPDYIINMNALHTVYGDHYAEYLEGTRFQSDTRIF